MAASQVRARFADCLGPCVQGANPQPKRSRAAMGAGIMFLASRDVRQGAKLAKDGAKNFRQNIKTMKEWAEEAGDEYGPDVLPPSHDCNQATIPSQLCGHVHVHMTRSQLLQGQGQSQGHNEKAKRLSHTQECQDIIIELVGT
jgi:hypothetical protein